MIRILTFLFLCLGLLFMPADKGLSLEPSDFPSLLSSIRVSAPLDFCGESLPIDNQDIRERFEKEFLLTLWDRPQVLLWLKRSRRYLPIIEGMLKKNEMPDDLKYIAIAESALRPHTGSRKGAVGFWQFVEYTGKKYGLIINGRIDERRNIFFSTKAAIGYFKDLYDQFGSWTLSAAAYNMGNDGLAAEILEQGTHDYYRLYLPLETQRYLFRLVSVKKIFLDREKYGFRLLEKDYYPPYEFDKIQVDCFQELPIRIIAQAANTHFKVIKDLNPHIRTHYMDEGSYDILIPKNAANGFQNRYQKLLKQHAASQKQRLYIVKKGDSLSTISDRFNVPLAAILIWNRLDPRVAIHPGDRLIIHKRDRLSLPAENKNEKHNPAASH